MKTMKNLLGSKRHSILSDQTKPVNIKTTVIGNCAHTKENDSKREKDSAFKENEQQGEEEKEEEQVDEREEEQEEKVIVMQ